MARRRMFDSEIVDTDLFLEMPQSSQNLYFHLGMRADDDGFVSNPKKIMKTIGASEDDYKILMVKKYLIPFENGVCVIRHWKINNYLRSDRYKETIYKDEKRLLNEDENGIYNIGIPNGYQEDTKRIPLVDAGKVSIGKNSIDKINIYGEFKRIKLTNSEYSNLVYEFNQDLVDKHIKLLDEYIEGNNNKNKYTNFNLLIRKSIRDKWFDKKSNNKTTKFQNYDQRKYEDLEKYYDNL